MLFFSLGLFFIVGYLAIVFEKFLRINKAAIALVMGVICWLLFFYAAPHEKGFIPLAEIADVAQIVFFLIAAMTIVELIDSHQGFKIVTDIFYTSSKKKRLWFLIILSFFMSAVLDNLTSMIVMVSLLKKMIEDQEERWLIGSMVVIAVNAGGAWTPIGDVTTTMLWINDKITTWETMKSLFLPSVVCTAVSGLLISFFIRGTRAPKPGFFSVSPQPGAKRVFFMGIGSLVMIPVWKAVFGLPPFMGALLGLGLLWLITDLIHFKHGEKRWHLRVLHVLTKIDTSGILLFLGILLAVEALTAAGLLKELAVKLQEAVPNQNWIAIAIGLVSSVVDNVPLVAAAMGMYDMTTYPTDSHLWKMIAYAAGTGGSILIIGSAAGVAFMGLEKIDFLWYFKKISWIALLGYFAGIATYLLI